MPARRTTPKGYENARKLRKELTPAERKLWAHLSNRKINGVKFRKQHAIGNYVPDFCAIKERLIIELDGSQHLEQVAYDDERTKYFESLGYRVIRFWNNQVTKELDAVILAIIHALEENQKGKPA
ncbi:MAG: endonuclease domain-containing protein [Anaerolineae bacterium]|nr:endonuclease domain-containing protein [Anaerolineae bacterium]